MSKKRLVLIIGGVVVGCLALWVVGVHLLFSLMSSSGFLPHAHLSDISRITGLDFPRIAVVADAYYSRLGPDYNIYCLVKIDHSEIKEFMDQELLKGKWEPLGRVGVSLPKKLQKRWQQETFKRGQKGYLYCKLAMDPDDRVDIIVCPQHESQVSTVYVLIHLL